MKNTNEVFATAKQNVLTAFPSIFTKEDVASIIDSIQTQINSSSKNENFSEDYMTSFFETLKEEIEGCLEDYDYSGSIDLDMSSGYNGTFEINTSFDHGDLERQIQDTIEINIEKFNTTFFSKEEKQQ